MEQTSIIVYSCPTCGYKTKTKTFLSEQEYPLYIGDEVDIPKGTVLSLEPCEHCDYHNTINIIDYKIDSFSVESKTEYRDNKDILDDVDRRIHNDK